MDEELERWARAWRSMEVKHVSIMKRAQAAHSYEAMWQGVLAAVLGSGVLMVAIRFERLAGSGWQQVLIGPPGVPGLALPVLSLAFGGWALWRSRQQIALARARLVETPLGFVTDLMRLRERELAGWVDKRVLIPGGVLTLAAIMFAVDRTARARAAGQPRAFDEGLLGLGLLLLVALVIFGIRRMRYLRHDLATLRELRSELEPER
jgi:hypothetical protein